MRPNYVVSHRILHLFKICFHIVKSLHDSFVNKGIKNIVFSVRSQIIVGLLIVYGDYSFYTLLFFKKLLSTFAVAMYKVNTISKATRLIPLSHASQSPPTL